jgi:hypothetical protein
MQPTVNQALGNAANRPAAAPRLIIDELLTPHERPLRLPLPRWAREVWGRLEEALAWEAARPGGGCQQMVRCFNESALIELLYGRKEPAQQLCLAALRWVPAISAQSRQPALLRFIVQPFVNLSRLDRMAGRWEVALEKLDAVRRLSLGQPVTLNGIVITRSHVEAFSASDPEFLSSLESMYLIDALKTALRAGQYDRIPQFAAAHRNPRGVALQDFLDEAAIMASCQKGDLEDALRRVELRCQQLGPNRAIFQLRRAELLACAGRRSNSLMIARGLAAAYVRSGASGELGLNKLFVLWNLIRLLQHLDQEVTELARLGATHSRVVGDVILREQFLGELVRRAPDERERAGADAELEELRRTSLYHAARSAAAGARASEGAVIDRLTEALLNGSTQDHSERTSAVAI